MMNSEFNNNYSHKLTIQLRSKTAHFTIKINYQIKNIH